MMQEALEIELQEVRQNPLFDSKYLNHINRAFADNFPSLKNKLSGMLSSALERAAMVPEPGSSQGQGQGQVKPSKKISGVHTEIRLESKKMQMFGRVDLISAFSDEAEICDFKTGKVNLPDLQKQLHTYSLLWKDDEDRNPEKIPVTRLTGIFGGETVEVSPLDDIGESNFREHLRLEIATAEELLQESPPKAVISEGCSSCRVRLACDDYWNEAPRQFVAGSHPTFQDVRCTLIESVGHTRWAARTDQGEDLFLDFTLGINSMHPGTVLRLMGWLQVSGSEDKTILRQVLFSMSVVEGLPPSNL